MIWKIRGYCRDVLLQNFEYILFSKIYFFENLKFVNFLQAFSNHGAHNDCFLRNGLLVLKWLPIM